MCFTQKSDGQKHVPAVIFTVLVAAFLMGEHSSTSALDYPRVQELSTDKTIHLNVPAVPDPAWAKGYFVHRMAIQGENLWFLASTKAMPRQHGLIKITQNGDKQQFINLGSGMFSPFLTSGGNRITLLRSIPGQAPELVQYDPAGTEIRRIQVQCGSALIPVGANIATLCPDGKVIEYDAEYHPSERPSWARLGTLSTFVSPNLMVVVDPQTGQILLNDLKQGSLRVLDNHFPEMMEATQQVADYGTRVDQIKQLKQIFPDPVKILACVSDDSSFYILISPIVMAQGAAVVRFSRGGEITGRFRCKIPTGVKGAIHQINLDEKRLYLFTTSGDLLPYDLM
jgi:hypothetical protein